MLYKQNQTKRLSESLFKNPTAEYRGTPFWAWNCKLEKSELIRQLDVFKKMGFGGAHMHVRTGLDTPYLSDEYIEMIKACVDKAKAEDMLAWLYDEDRWPSGAAGGLVTKDKRFRARYLLFTPTPYASGESRENIASTAAAGRAQNGSLLACFDVELSADGYLVSYKTIGENEPARHHKWYAYLETHTASPWYNNQTYVNTLDKASMDRFIDITYEAYRRAVGGEFGKTIPSIFTDEPQFTRKSTLRFAGDLADVTLPWTGDLPETFKIACGEELVPSIPELIWELDGGKISTVRYHYHDHVCERFAEAFADNCGAWCREHGIALTGHMMEEPWLRSQTAALGETMRSYRGFDLPGIDMLQARFEFTTAKQAQSAVHQYGCEGMLSELYGVTHWDFDFRDHKLHGDWQAALGVTIRVPHLSMLSMAGESKRDYPASINYQSPWWREYSYVEDHFARVNTAMTRGRPVVKVGVIHPIESYWLHWGPAEQTALVREEMDENFQKLTEWLLFGGIDFDFISESLLPSQCEAGGNPLNVGKMAYDVVLVPNCETLRSSTLERLEAFAAAGGKLVFVGATPSFENAKQSARGKKLCDKCLCVSTSRGAVLGAVESARIISIRDANGALANGLLTQLRQDNEGMWLFVAHGKEPGNKDISNSKNIKIRVKGAYKPTLYDTLTGQTKPIAHTAGNGKTEISCRLFDYDSLLLWLEPCKASSYSEPAAVKTAEEVLALPYRVPYTLSEPNAVLLDTAEYALDGGELKPAEEILRIDNFCRAELGLPLRKDASAQPWVVPREPITHSVRLKFTIHSDIDYTGAKLAIEDAERVALTLNGKSVASKIDGWYTDKSIKTVALPPIRKGENALEAVIPFGRRTNLEWCYLLGDFGVEVCGRYVKLTEKREFLAFSDIACQGLPFYGGNIVYHIPVETKGGELTVNIPHYRGALVKVSADGGEAKYLAYPPYTLSLGVLPAGNHTVDVEFYGHRRNGFGPVHLARLDRHIGPSAWRSDGDRWCYEYKLCEEGVISSPVIREIR